jgi:hypothetical protein
VAPHAYGLQAVMAPPWSQLPLPSQVLAVICAPPAHDAAVQTVPIG